MVIAGLDVGTTGCKIVLYNQEGRLLQTYYQEYEVLRNSGRHEMNFADVKNGVLALLGQAAKAYKIDVLGVTSFGETFAMLDEEGNILAPSMLYTDPRGEEECAALCAALGAEWLTQKTGVAPNPMYSIYKILWLKNHNPKAFAKCKHILLGEDYIVYTLTGVAQIDYSLAARTAAFDIRSKCWSAEILAAAGVDPALLSKPVPTGMVAGKLTPKMKESLGIDYDITVVNGCHDQVAGMIGAGVFDSTCAMDGTGTVECIPVILKDVPCDPAFYGDGYCVVPYLGEDYVCYAFSFTGGATLKWFRDTIAGAEVAEAKAAGKNVYALLDSRVPQGPTGILVLPHFAGAATPYMDSDSKAAFVGVTLETNRYDLYKALMEGTSYEMLLNFSRLQRFTGRVEGLRATGGGANSDVWLQIKADILGCNITALDCGEVGATGTAALAGLAVGAFQNLQSAVGKMVAVRKVVAPNPQQSAAYQELYKKYEGLYNAVRPLV